MFHVNTHTHTHTVGKARGQSVLWWVMSVSGAVPSMVKMILSVFNHHDELTIWSSLVMSSFPQFLRTLPKLALVYSLVSYPMFS